MVKLDEKKYNYPKFFTLLENIITFSDKLRHYLLITFPNIFIFYDTHL